MLCLPCEIQAVAPAARVQFVAVIRAQVCVVVFGLPGTSADLAAELAKMLPKGSAVVKAFNINLGDTLVAGTNGTTVTTVLYAGDYADAKEQVTALIEAAGMRAVDAGMLTLARELESMSFLQIIRASLGKTSYESGFTLLQ